MPYAAYGTLHVEMPRVRSPRRMTLLGIGLTDLSFSKGEGRAPSYSDLMRRLTLITEGIDFLLGHPDLKPSDRELGLFERRQTVLFGKNTDKNTVRQQAHVVRNLNRGTGRHEKTMQPARQRLRKLGFMRILMEPGDRRRNTYAPDFEFISQAVERIRTPEQIAPPPREQVAPPIKATLRVVILKMLRS